MLDLPADCLLRFAEDKRRELRITMVVFLIQFILVRFYMHAEIILLFSPFFSSFSPLFPPFSFFLPLFPPFSALFPPFPAPGPPQNPGGTTLESRVLFFLLFRSFLLKFAFWGCGCVVLCIYTRGLPGMSYTLCPAWSMNGEAWRTHFSPNNQSTHFNIKTSN